LGTITVPTVPSWSTTTGQRRVTTSGQFRKWALWAPLPCRSLRFARYAWNRIPFGEQFRTATPVPFTPWSA